MDLAYFDLYRLDKREYLSFSTSGAVVFSILITHFVASCLAFIVPRVYVLLHTPKASSFRIYPLISAITDGTYYRPRSHVFYTFGLIDQPEVAEDVT